ncbi:hypothetical protein ACFXPM_03125 [Streptomyces sp. NPDC059095]|nr:hypothetical protein [Streptomyces sp. CB01201]
MSMKILSGCQDDPSGLVFLTVVRTSARKSTGDRWRIAVMISAWLG